MADKKFTHKELCEIACKKQFVGSLSRKDGEWILSDVKPHVCMRLKRLFARIAEHSRPPFQLKDSPDVAADLVWFFDRYPFDMSLSDKKHLNKVHRGFLSNQAKSESILLPNYVPKERLGFKEGYGLRDYQKVAVDFAEHARSALILDEIGLGKTIEGLALATIECARPLVIVVQPHLHTQWHEKAVEFMDATIFKVEGNKPFNLPPADIYIMKYNQLSPWVDVLCEGWVKGIAFDEIQELRRGSDAAKGAAAKNICDCIEYKVGLTASLVYNYGIESFNIASIIRPNILGNRTEFLREWCSDSNDKGIVKDPDALGSYLIEQGLVIRRTKADVGQEAKQLEPHIEWLEHSQKAVALFEDITKKLAMKTLTATFSDSGQASREFDLKLRQLTGVSKAKQVAAYVRMFVQSGEPVLLYGWHREVYDIWTEELKDLNPVMFTGSELPKQKEAAKKAFMSGESKVLIMSLRSGAGIDGLQHVCSTVVFGELDWSGEVHRQCVGRLDRDGQKDEVFAFYAATQWGSDPTMIDVLGLKKSQSDGIMNPYAESNKIVKQVDSNRIKKMAQNYLKQNGVSDQAIEQERRKNRLTTEKQDMCELIDVLRTGSYVLVDEIQTQNDIEKHLIANNVKYEREKHFDNNIIDFFLPETGIALEVKAHKDWNKRQVLKQCERYCERPEVKGLVLATAKMQGLPKEIEGKPTMVYQLSLNAM